jgi:protein Mpv17
MLSTGWKMWPLVCLLNLIVVPFKYRFLVGNTAAFAWGVFISLRSL